MISGVGTGAVAGTTTEFVPNNNSNNGMMRVKFATLNTTDKELNNRYVTKVGTNGFPKSSSRFNLFIVKIK